MGIPSTENIPYILTSELYRPEKLRDEYWLRMHLHQAIVVITAIALASALLVGVIITATMAPGGILFALATLGPIFGQYDRTVRIPNKHHARVYQAKYLFECKVIERMQILQGMTEQQLSEIHQTITLTHNISETVKQALGDSPYHKLIPLIARHQVYSKEMQEISRYTLNTFYMPPGSGQRNFYSFEEEMQEIQRNPQASDSANKFHTLRLDRLSVLADRQQKDFIVTEMRIQQLFLAHLLKYPFHHGDFSRTAQLNFHEHLIVRSLEARYGEDHVLRFPWTDTSITASEIESIAEAKNKELSTQYLLWAAITHNDFFRARFESAHTILVQSLQKMQIEGTPAMPPKTNVIQNLLNCIPTERAKRMHPQEIHRYLNAAMLTKPQTATLVTEAIQRQFQNMFCQFSISAIIKSSLINSVLPGNPIRIVPTTSKFSSSQLTEDETAFIRTNSGDLNELFSHPAMDMIAKRILFCSA